MKLIQKFTCEWDSENICVDCGCNAVLDIIPSGLVVPCPVPHIATGPHERAPTNDGASFICKQIIQRLPRRNSLRVPIKVMNIVMGPCFLHSTWANGFGLQAVV